MIFKYTSKPSLCLTSNSELRVSSQAIDLNHEPRAGYLTVTRHLRREGWQINRKRVHRLWKQEGLKIPPKPAKKRARGNAAFIKRAVFGVGSVDDDGEEQTCEVAFKS